MSDRIHISRAKTTQVGSCHACGLHPAHDSRAPDTLWVIGLGSPSCRLLVRVCDVCLELIFRELVEQEPEPEREEEA